jgi:5-methylthioadenosine/S-adenosylhomocysteine deaminase
VHVDTRDLVFEPVGDDADVLSHLVWSPASRFVRDVWVGGRQVVADGACTSVDAGALRIDVAERATRLSTSD